MRRYETRSTMMTSNRPLEDWGKLIGDVPSATAILDRFLHHAEIIAITGKSYRLRNQPRTNRQAASGPAEFKTRHSARRLTSARQAKKASLVPTSLPILTIPTIINPPLTPAANSARHWLHLIRPLTPEMLEKSIGAYQNRAIETAQIIEELIELAKEMRDPASSGALTSKLTDDELAFYDVL